MKTRILFAVLMALAILAAGRARADWDGQGRLVTREDEGIMVLPGEKFQIDAGPRGCQALGQTVKLLGVKSSGGGTRCGFQAGPAGTDMIIIKGLVPRLDKRVPVKVLALSDLKRVTIAQLMVNPVDHQGKLFLLSGDNIGWGMPKKAKTVLSTSHSRSDWILEDETGAIYITGVMLPKEPRVKVVVTIDRIGPDWVVRGWTVEPAELILKTGVVNEMRPGQIAVIPLWSTKSTWSEPEIKGDAVTVVPGERNELRLRADKPGDAEVQVFTRWWYQDVSSAIVGAHPSPKPEAVYRIKVVAPEN